MSAYNAEKYLEESINSILLQKDVSFELIVINDGSNDNTLSLLKNLSAKDDRIQIIDKLNEGLPVALNIGIKASKGTFIARMDADDIAFARGVDVELFLQQVDQPLLDHAFALSLIQPLCAQLRVV